MLFDLDGTLVELRHVHEQALNAALTRCGYPPIPHTEHLARFDGLPTRVKLEMLGIPEAHRSAVNHIKQLETARLIGQDLRPDRRMLEELRRIRTDFFVGVVSNALLATCVAILLRSGIGKYVQLLIAGDMGVPKPDPDLYLKAVSAAHLDPAQTIAVEDNHYGLEAARRAGLRCLEVRNPADVTAEFIREGFHARQPA